MMMPAKPKGQPLDWSDADLDALSEVRLVDQRPAAALWTRNAPPWAQDLLDATPQDVDA
jgi:hypothetical protein